MDHTTPEWEPPTPTRPDKRVPHDGGAPAPIDLGFDPDPASPDTSPPGDIVDPTTAPGPAGVTVESTPTPQAPLEPGSPPDAPATGPTGKAEARTAMPFWYTEEQQTAYHAVVTDRIDTAPPPRPHRRGTVALVAFLAAVFGVLATIGLLALTGLFEPPEEPEALPPVTTIIERITQQLITQEIPAESAEAVGLKVVPSIVTVEVGTVDDGVFTITASGSGVVLQDNGVIVTNHHVIEDSTAARVVLQDGTTYDAEVVGSDPLTDLAVLSIEAGGLTAVEVGSTLDLAIGQRAIAVGNPLGQVGGASLTVGVISALSRQVDFTESSLFGMLQTDAPINSGSSGGALVDGEGRLIGITSAIGVSQAGAEGIGYAIPVELMKRITDEIIESGAVHHTFLGIEGDNHLTPTADGAIAPGGARIVSLFGEDSAAGAAGLIEEDVIVGVDGRQIRTMQDLVIALRLYRVGDEIEVEVLREGTTVVAVVVLGERPEGT